jgi:hypothetical protein
MVSFTTAKDVHLYLSVPEYALEFSMDPISVDYEAVCYRGICLWLIFCGFDQTHDTCILSFGHSIILT